VISWANVKTGERGRRCFLLERERRNVLKFWSRSLENLKESMNSKASLWMAIFSFAVSGATWSVIYLTKCVYYLTDTGQRKVMVFCECANKNSGFTNRSKILAPFVTVKFSSIHIKQFHL